MNNCEILILDLKDQLKTYFNKFKETYEQCLCLRLTKKDLFVSYMEKIEFHLIILNIDGVDSDLLSLVIHYAAVYPDRKFIFIHEEGVDNCFVHKQKNIHFFSLGDFYEGLEFFIKKEFKRSSDRVDKFVEFAHFIFDHNLQLKDLSGLISDLTRKKRQKLSLNQGDFSHKIGMSLRQLQRVESGKSNLTLDNFLVLLKGLVS